MVAEIVHALEAKGVLNNTYVIFTSDNGFHLGQFAQGADKRQPYETDIRVPLLIRGPGVQPKSMCNSAVGLVDILPTLLDLASIEMPTDLDGVSFAAQLLRPQGNDDDTTTTTTSADDEMSIAPVVGRQILVQHWGEGDESTFTPHCGFELSDNLAVCYCVMGDVLSGRHSE